MLIRNLFSLVALNTFVKPLVRCWDDKEGAFSVHPKGVEIRALRRTRHTSSKLNTRIFMVLVDLYTEASSSWNTV